MLIIQRRIGERIVMSNGIEVIVTALSKRSARLALRVPDGITVLRGEVYDAVASANAAAADSFEEEAEARGEAQGGTERHALGSGDVP